MNRDFVHLNTHLNRLMDDIYPQPEDSGHTHLAEDVFYKWFKSSLKIKSILDVGCGDTAFMMPMFESINVKYTGVALKTSNPKVTNMDFSFLEYEDNSFDCILSRHSLEHSPMPLVSLMEWNRVSRHFLCLILPNPEYYGWTGLNHYSVLHPNQAEFLLKRAGWNIIWTDFSEPTELRYMCEKDTQSEYDKAKRNEE